MWSCSAHCKEAQQIPGLVIIHNPSQYRQGPNSACRKCVCVCVCVRERLLFCLMRTWWDSSVLYVIQTELICSYPALTCLPTAAPVQLEHLSLFIIVPVKNMFYWKWCDCCYWYSQSDWSDCISVKSGCVVEVSDAHNGDDCRAEWADKEWYMSSIPTQQCYNRTWKNLGNSQDTADT